MPSLLTVPSHYDNYVIHLWSQVHNNETIIMIVLLFLVCIFGLLACMLSRVLPLKSWIDKIFKTSVTISLASIILLVINLVWSMYVADCQDPTVFSPVTIGYTFNGHNESSYTRKPNTVADRIVLHNHKQIPHEWRISQKLFVKAHINNTNLTFNQFKIKQQYSHKYHHELHHIYAQEHFDKLNGKFLNKYYIAKPVWYYNL